MTPDKLRRDVDQLVQKLWDAALILDSNITVVEPLAQNERRITWTKASGFALFEYPSIDEYVRILRERQYTALLYDGSLLQISYDIKLPNEISGHRLCYFPCPIEINREVVEEFGLIDLIEMLSGDELRTRVRLESPVRFEFDPDAASEHHPASHLTLSRNTCRIPVFAPLNLRQFFQFVFLNFYSERWKLHPFLGDAPSWECDRTLSSTDMVQLHVDCKSGRPPTTILNSTKR